MISIIVVSYNTKTILRDCLASIYRSTMHVPYEVIVVDNKSIDGSQDMIREVFPQTVLIENKDNVGFARANNQGVKVAGFDYLLFLNSDTIIRNDAITQLFQHLKTNPRVGIVGPKILNSDHRPTRSYMRFLDARMFLFGSKYLGWLIDIKKYRMHYDHYDFFSTQNVPWLSGACLMMRRSVFQEAGCFDEHYFMYLEDMDLCMQVKNIGYSNVFLPSAEIVHLFGGSTGPKKKESKRIYKESTNHYFQKNFSIIEYWLARLLFSVVYH